MKREMQATFRRMARTLTRASAIDFGNGRLDGASEEVASNLKAISTLAIKALEKHFPNAVDDARMQNNSPSILVEFGFDSTHPDKPRPGWTIIHFEVEYLPKSYGGYRFTTYNMYHSDDMVTVLSKEGLTRPISGSYSDVAQSVNDWAQKIAKALEGAGFQQVR